MKRNVFFGTLLAVLVMLLVANITVTVLSNPKPAYAAKRYVYKVNSVGESKRAEQDLNRMAEQGWEYVGQFSNDASLIYRK